MNENDEKMNFLIESKSSYPFGVQVSLHYDMHDPRLFKHPEIHLPDTLKGAVLKRQAEFMAGRLCAYEAMSFFRYEGDKSVAFCEDRSPIWPVEFKGSITHTEETAVVVIGLAEMIEMIGIDLEGVMSDGTYRLVASRVLNKNDALKAKHSAFWGTLIFSAKESLYKALYPEVRKFFGFEAASLLEIDEVNQTFLMVLEEDWSKKYTSGYQLTGRYEVWGSQIYTSILL